MGRELMARLEGERAAARAQVAPALDARWWDTAKAEDIVRVHQTATAWKSQDPMARSAADAVREQVQQRYGIDVDALGTGAENAAALHKAARAKTHAQEERTAAAGENTQATQLLAEAERADKTQRQNVEADNAQPEQLTNEADTMYDSAERWEALAKSLDHIADKEAVQARLTADRNQATPPAAALSTTHSKAPKPRKTRAATGATKQAQKGLGR